MTALHGMDGSDGTFKWVAWSDFFFLKKNCMRVELIESFECIVGIWEVVFFFCVFVGLGVYTMGVLS